MISGKVPRVEQFVMAGFEIESKIDATEAYRLFPEQRLQVREDGQLTGNIIVDASGKQHALDDHKSFDRRIENYVVGKDLISLETLDEIATGRRQTIEALRDILHKRGNSPFELVGRFGTQLTEEQIRQLRQWLAAIKKAAS